MLLLPHSQPYRSSMNYTGVTDSVLASETSWNKWEMAMGKFVTDWLIEDFDASNASKIYTREQALWVVVSEILSKMHVLLVWLPWTGFAFGFIRERVWFSLWSLADFLFCFFIGSPGLLTMPHYKQCFSWDTVYFSAVVSVNRRTGETILPTFQT